MNGQGFRTKDHPLTAFLHVKGVPYMRMENEPALVSRRGNYNREKTKINVVVFWIFEDTESLRELIESYANDEESAHVNPRTYYNALSFVRFEMFQYLDAIRGSAA